MLERREGLMTDLVFQVKWTERATDRQEVVRALLTSWLGVASDAPVLLAHIAGEGANGFRVVDVWASDDAFRRFGDKLMPVSNEIGVDGDPEIYAAHTFVSA